MNTLKRSLTPLIFVLLIDPLSQRLDERYHKVSIHAEKISLVTNHLLFIDDFKLLAFDKTVIGNMVKKTEFFFKTIGLQINQEKSAVTDSSAKTLLFFLIVLKYIYT
ncbi:hypothetical protein TCON_2726 [Astathelohania contejeani]|uniref:Reverse transcriptase domain-containing protein n=1 Tax=Astathelohania contejeani TaxID=164912 RepID=A0ABQ7HV80_9MICR|nr:hypothetical protein TCON_2726 [Thelohania contejeani]